MQRCKQQRPPHRPCTRTALRGFTLMEVIIAIGLLALISAISWRGLDGMLRTHESVTLRSQRMDILQTSLAQWNTDLNNIVEIATLPPLDWDGKVLRITRHAPRAGQQSPAALQVVAWADRQIDGQNYWMRWQSPPLHSRQAWTAAWQNAKDWAHTAGAGHAANISSASTRDVALLPITQWQIYYSREGHWVNPHSSAQTQNLPLDANANTNGNNSSGGNGNAAASGAGLNRQPPALPDSIRLRLQLAPAEPTPGWIETDWLNPVQGNSRL